MKKAIHKLVRLLSLKSAISTLFLIINLSAICQNVNIPDANFKNYLLARPAINTNADTEIQISEATLFTGEINVSNDNITDLTGIETFTQLTSLICDSNSLTDLNVSSNTHLTHLSCSNNSLTSLILQTNGALTYLDCNHNFLFGLDVSVNNALTFLDCSNNGISSLVVSSNLFLNYLNCGNNHLSDLDVSANTALTYLNCASETNLLYILDVSANTGLTILNCSDNWILDLDVSANTALTELDCGLNSLTTLDVSANTLLTYLNCFSNSFSSLDVSANTALTSLDCHFNVDLTSLNVKNGNNNNFTSFLAYGAPLLNCIKVDNVAWANANWQPYIDVTASFSEDCIGICSANFSLYPDTIPLYYNAYNFATGTDPISYVWSWGDGTYDSIAYPFHSYDISGNYTICLTISDSSGCTDNYCNDYTFKTESPIAYINVIDPLTSIKENNIFRFIAYPIPTTNTLTVETTLQQNTTVQTVIINGLGQIVYTLNEKANSGLYKKAIDLNLGQGIYFLTLQTDQGLMTKKIEIVK